MTRPAFLVEGVMEQRIIQRLCPGAPVRLIGCNGKGVPIKTLAKFVWAHLRQLRDKHHPIVIAFDREKRTESSEQISASLIEAISEMGYNNKLIVGVPDRSIENWILAGRDSLGPEHGLGSVACDCEGTLGKGVIRNHLPEGTYYTEAVIGVDLFCSVAPEYIYKNSSSFRYFVSQAHFHCRWLRAINPLPT